MFLRISTLVAISLLTLSLQGCIISNNDSNQNANRYEQQWQKTRNTIANLTPGDSYREVSRKLGDAAFSESFARDDKQYKILFYRTHFAKSDGHVSKDECTPVIFKDNELLGWGEVMLQDIIEH